jgi:hypothetical protein
MTTIISGTAVKDGWSSGVRLGRTRDSMQV